MKKTINVEKKHLSGIINDLDQSNYFMLGKSDSERKELFNFALAIGLGEGVPTPLETNDGLIRTEYVSDSMYMYQGIFYKAVIADNPDKIDEIADRDAVLELIEKYANTGFYRLMKMKEEFQDEELFMLKLLNDMDRIYDDYLKSYDVTQIITE